MSKDVITVDGEKRVVREDTAKAYRGTIWAFISLGVILGIAFALFLGGFFGAVSDGKLDNNPATIESQRK